MSAPERAGDMTSKRALGAAIVYHRERANLTTAQAARRAKLSPQALHAIERGQAEPHWGTTRRIAPALGVGHWQIAEAAERLERGEKLPA